MNYLKELVAFDDWLEVNPLEATTQTLWYRLMAIANKSGWPEWFTVANLTLQAKLSITENTLNKHRNYLLQKGRIEYVPQGKKKAGKYRIIPFSIASKNEVIREVPDAITANFEAIREVKCEANREVKCEVNHAALFKLNETKENERIIPSITRGEHADNSINLANPIYESFYNAHHRIFGFYCNQKQVEALGAYIDSDGMEEAVIINAFDRAALYSQGYNFKFIQSCVENYARSNVKTLAEAKAFDIEFDARQASRGSRLLQKPSRGNRTPSGKPQLPVVSDSTAKKPARSREDVRAAADRARNLDGLPPMTDAEFEEWYRKRGIV